MFERIQSRTLGRFLGLLLWIARGDLLTGLVRRGLWCGLVD